MAIYYTFQFIYATGPQDFYYLLLNQKGSNQLKVWMVIP